MLFGLFVDLQNSNLKGIIMSLDNKALALATAVGADIKILIDTVGTLGDLSTVDKTSLVGAVNELQSDFQAILDLQTTNNDSIDDLAGAGILNKTWSADKIISALEQVKNEIIAGAPEAYDTLQEIAAYLTANTQNINDLLTNLAGTVRYDDVQSLTDVQQQQSCTNIGIGSKDVDARSSYLIASDINTFIDPGFVEPGYVA